MSDWDDVRLPDGWRLIVVDRTDSTNDEIRQWGGEPEGLVVLAERQMAGRGRRGAAWLSVEGESLTFSVLLRPLEAKALWPRLSLAAGLAVADALLKFGLEARIKWPNDVLIGGKKVCGILVEAGADHVIVGIGLNTGTLDFPEGLDATSIQLETGQAIDRGEVLSLILQSLNGWSSEIGAGFPFLLERVRERCALSGQHVRMTSGERPVQGKVLEIGASGDLVVETESGTERFLQAHDVRVIS
jgi:BirA family biotin operon repressor/biotin-[acetyl-CoA-carboxylase] ligase